MERRQGLQAGAHNDNNKEIDMPASIAAPWSARMAEWAWAGAAGLALAALAWLAFAPPKVQPPAAAIDAPAWQARALVHVTTLAATPRAIATPDNARARDYIVGQLRAMGLSPEVQRATVRKSVVRFFGGTHMTIGVVHNIVARIPGSAQEGRRRPALLLATHYDSGPHAPGAARSAAPSAALLETARQLLADAPGANDIVLLFADGEHVGALGARGFVEQHPLAGQIGLALAFDSAGSGGPLLLYGASGAGGDTLRRRARVAPEMQGSSLLAELVQRLPDTPRVGPLAELDAPVLLFANAERRFDDAGSNDTVARLERATLLHTGDAMLRLAREFAHAPLARGRHEAHSWFTLPLVGPVHHSTALTWHLAQLSLLLLLGACVLSFARSGAEPAVQGLFGTGLILLAARMGAWSQREALAAAGPGLDHGAALAIGAVIASLFVAALYLLRRFIGTPATVLGAMGWTLVALVVFTALLPGAGYLLAWPLAGALAAFVLLQSGWAALRSPAVRLPVALAGLAPAAILFPQALRDAWLGLAPHGLYLPAVVIGILMLCFASLLLALRIGHMVAAALALALAAGLTLPGRAAAPAPPGPVAAPPARLVYFKDMNTWRAYWLMPPQPLDGWTRRIFADRSEPAIFVETFGWHSPRQWYTVAPRDDALSFPETIMLRNSRTHVRHGAFTVRSKNRAPHIEMWVSGTRPLRSRLDGQPLTSKEGGWWLSLYGMEDRLLHFEIEADREDIFAVTVEERMPGLPGHLLPPRPRDAPPLLPGTGKTVTRDILRFY